MAKQTFTTGQVLTASQMSSLQQTAMGGGSTTAKTASYTLVALDAGTVVQMNSASATTITVNTALFAAGDTVQIQNVGAGVCTVTAGTATVSTSATLALKQYDAGSLYFNTTSAAIFFAVDAADGMANVLTTTGDIIYSSSGTTAARLGIGTTGNLLTVSGGLPVWSAPAGGGKVLQVVYAATTTSTNIATTTLTTTTLTASITPSLVSSKVLIIANNNVYIDSAGRGAAAAITTGATTLIHQTDTNNAGTFNLSDSRGSATIPIQFLHSPSTTSSITYTIKATSIGAANVTFQNGGSPSNILLFEIGA